MRTLYIVSRGLAAFFGFTLLLGVLWFAGSSGGTAILVPGMVMGFSSLAAAFVPTHKLSLGTTRGIVVTLCILGIVAGIVLVANDISAPSGIEWDVVAMRLLHMAALATLAIISKRCPDEMKRNPGKRE